MKALCERYGVTRAGYYAWRRRETSCHDHQDERLVARIRAIFGVSEGTYGSPRIDAALVQASWPVGRKRVARLMRSLASRRDRHGSTGARRARARSSRPSRIACWTDTRRPPTRSGWAM